MDYGNIARYVACDYDCAWWVGCVSSTEEEETDTMKTIFLHHNGPSPS
jgi:hypothetical protein